MRFATAASALIALSASAVAQNTQTWDDNSAPAAVSTVTQATTTITKTLSFVHTETVYGNSTTTSASSTISIVPQTSVAAETTSVGAAPVPAAPTGVSGAASMSRDVVLAVIAAGAVAFWTS